MAETDFFTSIQYYFAWSLTTGFIRDMYLFSKCALYTVATSSTMWEIYFWVFFQEFLCLFTILSALTIPTLISKSTPKPFKRGSIGFRNSGTISSWILMHSLGMLNVYALLGFVRIFNRKMRYSLDFGFRFHPKLYVFMTYLIYPLLFLFLLYFARYCSNTNSSFADVIFLFIFFLIFVKALFSAHDLFIMYLCLEGITYIIYLFLLAVSINNIRYNVQIYKNIFIKYFVFNSISSLFILFSISILFMLCGSLNFNYLLGGSVPLLKFVSATFYKSIFLLVLSFLFLGFFFKLLLFPFFFWAQDFYENMPTPLFIFLSTIYKLIIFTFFVKILIKLILYSTAYYALTILCVFGFFSFFAGFLGALFTTKIRTFIFYTSVNQVGLCLLGFGLISNFRDKSLLLSIVHYFYIYIITLFFFLCLLYSIMVRSQHLRHVEYFNELYSLKNINSAFTFLLASFLFSFAGIPPFVGFFIKYNLFWNFFLINPTISVFCVVCSLISSFYYIALICNMFFHKNLHSLFDLKANSYKYYTSVSISSSITIVGVALVFALFSFFYSIIPMLDFRLKRYLFRFFLR